MSIKFGMQQLRKETESPASGGDTSAEKPQPPLPRDLGAEARGGGGSQEPYQRAMAERISSAGGEDGQEVEESPGR